jgi:hypothetical protein
MAKIELPKIDFFNVRTGETVEVSRPAQIKAAIESSDLGVNRQSDRGWRLGKKWITKLRKARTDKALIESLVKKSGGEVTDTNLLVALWQREARMAKQRQLYEENDAPFEEQYQNDIRPKNNN